MAGANTFPHALFAATLSDMVALHVAPLEDGVRCWVDAEEEYFVLDKDSGLPPDPVNIILPLAGAPIAGAADARWLRNFFEEFREIIPVPEGQVATQASRPLQANLEGASYLLTRDALMNKLIAYVSGAPVGAPVGRFLIYQGISGGSGVAKLIASGDAAIVGLGELVVPFLEGAVKISEGIIYVLFGLQNPGGGNLSAT